MKTYRDFIITALLVLSVSVAFAGSPISKTSFFTAYYLNEQVQYAEEKGILDGVLGAFLIDQTAPVDLKAAVINALPCDERGKTNVETFKMFIARKYGKPFESIPINEISGDDLFCLGYLTLLHDPKDITKAIGILENAKSKQPESFTIRIIYSLALAQNHLDNSDGCSAWSVCDGVRSNLTIHRDLNDEAISLIFAQVDPLKEECK